MNATTIPLSPWSEWRQELLQTAHEADHSWLEEEDIREILQEARLKGVSTNAVISCRELWGRSHFPQALRKAMAGKKKKILLVDPNADELARLAKALLTAGIYEVRAAAEARQALRVAQEFQPDAVVIETALPGSVNGMGLVHFLKNMLGRPIPALMVESVLSGTDVSTVSARGTLHLQKPVKLRTLLHCLESLLSEHAPVVC